MKQPNRETFEIWGMGGKQLQLRYRSLGWGLCSKPLSEILAEKKVRTFFYRPHHDSDLHCTVRAERKQRGGLYWVAYRREGGHRAKVYVGKVGDITTRDLWLAASKLEKKLNVTGSKSAQH